MHIQNQPARTQPRHNKKKKRPLLLSNAFALQSKFESKCSHAGSSPRCTQIVLAGRVQYSRELQAQLMKGRAGRCNLTTSKADHTTANVYRCRLSRCYGSNRPIKSNNNPWSRVSLIQFDRAWNERLQMPGPAQSR